MLKANDKKPEIVVNWPKTNSLVEDRKNGRTFELNNVLGEGAFSRCYQIKDLQSNKLYCCKLISRTRLTTKMHKERLRQELKLQSSLKHQNIIKVYYYFSDKDFVYIILELCKLRSMKELLKIKGRLEQVEARFYFLQIIEAVRHCHSEKVIHRDLKLSNIMLTEDHNIKLGDFGFAKKFDNKRSRRNTMCGTLNYIAPEVIAKKQGHSFQTDIWATGIILYTMLVGVPPFHTNDCREVYSKIQDGSIDFPVDLTISETSKDLILSLLNFCPEKRPSFESILLHPFFECVSPNEL